LYFLFYSSARHSYLCTPSRRDSPGNKAGQRNPRHVVNVYWYQTRANSLLSPVTSENQIKQSFQLILLGVSVYSILLTLIYSLKTLFTLAFIFLANIY
jgi:hypothetical protein